MRHAAVNRRASPQPRSYSMLDDGESLEISNSSRAILHASSFVGLKGASFVPIRSGFRTSSSLPTATSEEVVIDLTSCAVVAVILAGGRGSRLMPVTNEVPKPMLEVAGRPILERIVTHLVGFGIQRIAISVGYLHEQIEEHFSDGEKFGCQILYLREDPATPLGTGGPLAMLEDIYPDLDASVLVLNGDLVTQFNVADLLESHKESGSSLTIGVVSYTHEVPFGVLELSDVGLVSAISEKPIIEKMVSAGIYACEPRILRSLPRGQFMPMTRIIDESLSRGEEVSIWNCDNEWSDIGRPQDLARAKGHL